jgi:PAS domain S-box-containing protein
VRLKGFENIVSGFMEHENICLAVFQKSPPWAVFINRGFEILTGYTRDEVLRFTQTDFENLIHPEMRYEFFQRYNRRLKGEDLPKTYEFKMIKKDGAILTVQAFVYLVEYNNQPSVVFTIVDITTIKETEKALRESRENYRLLFNRTPVSIFYFDRDMRINHFNEKFIELIQVNREKLCGFGLHDLADKSILPCIESSLNGRNGCYKGKINFTADSSGIAVSMRTEPVFDENGVVSGGVGIVEDITRVYEAEEALLKSEENFKDMIDKSPLPISIVDDNDVIIYNNRECFNVFGFRRREITDLKSWWVKAYPDPAYREIVIGEWYSGYKISQKKKELFGPREYRVTSADGTVKDIQFYVVPVGDLSFIMMNDMTSHRKAEAELLKTKKIESIGILAGGIAHDFNNILTAIIGNLNLARMDITETHKSYELLEATEKAAWQARELTQQLLTFSKGGNPIMRVLPISRLLQDSAMSVLEGRNIRAEFNVAENLWEASIDEGQIAQVIHNLVLNSAESMTGGGVIKISADNFNCEGIECLIFAGNYIRIRIEDAGAGIKSSVISNIFDPFFTTKPSGTGLGLSVSYSIIKKHGGNIRVSSVEGEGALFEIFLPASPKRNIQKEAAETRPDKPGGKILLLDDEELILDISKKMLNRMGYEVVLSKDGEDAIFLYKEARESGSPFDCVIMDLTIPGGMGGKDAILILKEYDPEVKAVVSSGYSSDPVMSDYMKYGFSGVSEKPYSFEDLKKEIERVIKNGKPS